MILLTNPSGCCSGNAPFEIYPVDFDFQTILCLNVHRVTRRNVAPDRCAALAPCSGVLRSPISHTSSVRRHFPSCVSELHKMCTTSVPPLHQDTDPHQPHRERLSWIRWISSALRPDTGTRSSLHISFSCTTVMLSNSPSALPLAMPIPPATPPRLTVSDALPWPPSTTRSTRAASCPARPSSIAPASAPLLRAAFSSNSAMSRGAESAGTRSNTRKSSCAREIRVSSS